jgi:hypothetical protein
MRSLFRHVKLFSDRLDPMVIFERTQKLSENSVKVFITYFIKHSPSKSPGVARFDSFIKIGRSEDMHPTTPCMNLVTQAALVFRDVAIIRELCNQVSSQVLLWSKDVELETRRMLRSLEMRLYKRYRARAA